MRTAIAAGAYALLALLTTFPLVRHLGESLPGITYGDQTQYLWCVDTFWTQILAGRSPFWTDRVLYPIGANLMHTGLAPFVSLFALPLRSHLLLYLALVVLVSLVFAGLGMRALVARLTGDNLAATLAGCFFAFSPQVLSFTDSSHYYKVVSAALLPWGLTALVAFLRAPGARALTALSAVAWCLVFTDYYMTVLFMLFVLILGAASLRRAHLPWIGAGVVANLVLVWALMRWVLPPLDTSELMTGGASFWGRANINLADILVPSGANPLLGSLGRFAFDRPNGDVDCYYFGIGVFVLACFAFTRPRVREVVPLAVTALVCVAFACGTVVRVGTHVILSDAWTPWFWLVKLPSLNVLDLPRCFVLGLQLVFATLAGVGLARLLAGGRRRRVLAAVALVLVAVEYAQIGMRIWAPAVPDVYRRLAAMPNDRTLLELPSGVTESKLVFGFDLSHPTNNEQMFLQTVHRKRRIGAYLSRVPRSTYEWFEAQPVIGEIFLMTNPQLQAPWVWRSERNLKYLPDYPPKTVDAFLQTFDLGYVLVQPNSRQEAFTDGMDRLLAGRIASRERDADGYVLYVLKHDGE